MAKVLTIIPARGGSKGIPRKNIIKLNNYPLISYSIEASLSAKLVTRTIVSTDDEEISAVSRKYGAEVPFLRPPEFARDNTPDLPVFKHALNWLKENEGYVPDYIVQLRPTSPLRPVNCVDEAVQLLFDNPDADSVRSVMVAGQNPYKMWKINEKFMAPILKSEFKEPYNMPRQKLPITYWQTGHIDVFRYKTVEEQNSLTGRNILSYEINPRYSIDIDTMEDLDLTKWKLKSQKLSVVKPELKIVSLEKIEMAVFDFDGVFTDDKVLVSENGLESVVCSRGDGMGIERLKKIGIKIAVISKEKNKVASVRCEKLGIPCYYGIENKKMLLSNIIDKENILMENVVFVGNDVNDVECIKASGVGVAVGNAVEEVKNAADIVLENNGGDLAVREICELLINSKTKGI